MNFTFERTHDMDLVKAIVTHPKVYGHISDDAAPSKEQYRPNPDLFYLLVKRDGESLGLWAFYPMGEQWEVHTCLLPASYGIAAVAMRACIRWIWANTPCTRITTVVPVFNRLAIQLGKAVEMAEYERREQAFEKNGQKYDVLLMALDKPKEAPCRF